MKKLCLAMGSLLFIHGTALEYEVQLENESVTVARVKIMPQEEIGLHRDEHPQVVFAIQGGTITRLEADGTENEVEFPKGKAVYRGVDPAGELHKSVNRGKEPVELLIIQMKGKSE